MKKYLLVLTVFILGFSTLFSPITKAEPNNAHLSTLEPEESRNLVVDQWKKNSPLQLVDGTLVTNGIGLDGDSGNEGRAVYNIQDMGFKRLSGTLSLDSKWINGDYGKTAIGILADDEMLFEKQVTPSSSKIKIDLKLPQKVKKLKIIVKQKKGSKGVHGVVFADALLSKEGPYLHTNDLNLGAETIGIEKDGRNYNFNEWSTSNVFQDVNENLVIRGLGFTKTGSGTSLATFNIDKMGFNVFEARASIDSKWSLGDYGRTTIGVYADDYLLYEKEFTPKTISQNMKLNIPVGTKKLNFVVKQIKGAKGNMGIVLANPMFKKTSDKKITAPKTALFSTVGAIKYSPGYSENEVYGLPMQLSNNQLVTTGVSLTGSVFSSQGYAIYDIKALGFNALKTTIGIDPRWASGSAAVNIFADGTKIYTASLVKKDIKYLTLRLPNNTKQVKIDSTFIKGANGYPLITFGNSTFANLPVSDKVAAKSVVVKNNKGKSDTIQVDKVAKDDVIKVYNSSNALLVSGKASSASLTLSVKQLGTKKGTIFVTKTSPGKLESDKVSISYKAE